MDIKKVNSYYSSTTPMRRIQDPDGTVKWYVNGWLQKDDGPAMECPNGTLKWYKGGKLHRDDGPAVMHTYGDLEWYKCGKLHREDGPAAISYGGYSDWYIEGIPHRTDGPARTGPSGSMWYINGVLHREDGPAVICQHGSYVWYTQGKPHRDGGPAYYNKCDCGLIRLSQYVYEKGSTVWFSHGKIHREDGPAYITNHILAWYIDGERHREDGPAVIMYDGTLKWYVRGTANSIINPDGTYSVDCHTITGNTIEWHSDYQLHREDGPALITTDGTICWALDDIIYMRIHTNGDISYPEIENALNDTYLNSTIEDTTYDNIDGPAIITYAGDCTWLVDNELDDTQEGPARIMACGTVEWSPYSEHCERGGPFCISNTGVMYWPDRTDLPDIIRPDGSVTYSW